MAPTGVNSMMPQPRSLQGTGMSACRVPMVASPIGATRDKYQRKQASGGGITPLDGHRFRPSSARPRYGAQRRCDATNGKRFIKAAGAGLPVDRPRRQEPRPGVTPQGLFSRAISISCPHEPPGAAGSRCRP